MTATGISNNFVANVFVGMSRSIALKLRKGGANWVEGDRFFNRDVEIEALRERVGDGTHTLLTAQRRMGKTSLVRELLRRLEDEGCFATVFVDLEASHSPQDAVAEIGAQSKSVRSTWHRIGEGFANTLRGVADRVEALSVSELQVKLRAGIDAGNWQQKGDEILQALAENDLPVVLALDELPILVNRLLKGQDYRITPKRRQEADALLAWLRRCGQAHRGRICMILSGSVGLEPVLRHAGLSAHANIFAPLDLKPWDDRTASGCLRALANNYSLDLPPEIRRGMCRRLRCNIPHHVQQLFDCLHEFLRRAGRREASEEDVERAYREEMLGPRGQIDLDHYESRLKMVLGPGLYRIALELLTEAAVEGGTLSGAAIDRYRQRYPAPADADPAPVESVLNVLEHDGYRARLDPGYRFVSGLLEDWWRARHGRHFVPIGRRPA